MSDFNFAKALEGFNGDAARNILFIGDSFDFEKDKPLLDLKWNTVFCFLQDESKIMQVQLYMQNDSRQVKRLDNLDEAEKIAHQFDYRNLNFISLWAQNNPDFINAVNAIRSIKNFCAKAICHFGCAYFVGYTENCWFEKAQMFPLLTAVYPELQRENCIIIDRCSADSFANFKATLSNVHECRCFSFIEESLAEMWCSDATASQASQDWDDDYFEPEETLSKHVLFINNKSIALEKKEIRDIASFATLLDYEELTPAPTPKYLHPSSFAAFLKNNSNYPKWYSYAEKYALVRSYQKDLTEIVTNSLQNPSNFDYRPILLHGQSGAGKSVALGQLAYDIFHEKKFPVIYITNPQVAFSPKARIGTDARRRFDALSHLIKTLQNVHGAKSTLLIWDCSGFEYERTCYLNLYSALREAGLNVTLVGTNYQLAGNNAHLKDFYTIEAPIQLNQDERAQFRSILKNKARLDTEDIDALFTHSTEDSFLVILYNIFWELRNDISRGIYAEFRETVKDILHAPTVTNEGLFGDMFVRNFEKFNDFLASMNTEQNEQEKLKDFTITAAMLTYFNMPMSIDMIHGLLASDMDMLLKVLNAPIFSKSEQDGNYYYKIRSRLEAELLLRAHNLNPKSDNKEKYVVCLCRLLYLIERENFGSYAADEAIEKVTRIIAAVGPNSKPSDVRWKNEVFYEYAPCLINALAAAGKATEDPRIINQELTLTRELKGKEALSCSYEDFYRILSEARDYTPDAATDDFFSTYTKEDYKPILSDVKIEDADRYLRNPATDDYHLSSYYAQIKVELANCLLAFEKDQERTDADRLHRAERLCEDALRTPHKTNAPATLIWLKVHLLRAELSKDEQESIFPETIDRISFFTQKYPELVHGDNNSSFIGACADFFEAFKENVDVDSLAEKLHTTPTASILYLCAFRECIDAGIISVAPPDAAEQKKINKKTPPPIEWKAPENPQLAVDIYNRFFNEKYFSVFKNDVRCLNLQMRLFWVMHNKAPLNISGEKQKTTFTQEQWSTLISICGLAKMLDPSANTFYLRFVLALAYAQCDNFADYNAEISRIKDESTFDSFNLLPFPRYILCHPDGTPKKCKGVVTKECSGSDTRGRMDIYMEETNLFLPDIFYNKNNLTYTPAKGDTVEDICLGFSHKGLSALHDKEDAK